MMLPLPFVRPSGAPSEGKVPHPSMDPRDGPTPPALPDRSPANPVAVAALLSGNPNVTEANVTAILGAPVAQLIRDKSSILYGGGKSSTKSSGAVDAPKSSKVVSVFVPNAKGTPPPAPPVPVPAKVSPVSVNGGALVEWATTRLAESGIRCGEWTAMGEPARINTTRNFFYGVQSLLAAQLAGVSLPTNPEDLRDAINIACGLPIGPRDAFDAQIAAPAARSPSRDQSAAWWASARAAGVTCDQWYAAQEWQRFQMVQSLTAQWIIDRGPWSDWQVMQAIGAECQRSVEPATSDPTASIRARLRAILDCANLDAQDKLQQFAVIQRAFPELNRDPRALYRLALARYDACHPASEGGWRGDGFGNDDAAVIRSNAQHGFLDVLGGDTAGMSWAQWVKQGPYMESGSPDLFDPIQGATGDCYFISAMASVAWTQPTTIARNGVVVSPDRRRFTFAGSSVDVSDRTPCRIISGFLPIFARGNRLNDQWPGVMEKAYAAWKSDDATDRPDVTSVDNMPSARARQTIEGVLGSLGGAVSRSLMALPALTGGSLFWHLTYFRSDDDLFDLLATHCTPDGRARVPMVAGTYPSGGFVDRTGLAASHAYSVLGFGFHRDGRKFVVLRNPWGSSWAGLPSSEYLVPVEGRWLNRLNLNHGDGGCFALAHGAFSAAFSVLYGAQ
jgi:hypothetical protein